MAGGEGVVDVHVPEHRQAARQAVVIPLLAGVEAQVLQQQHLAGPQLLDGMGGLVAHHLVGLGDGDAVEELAQPLGHRVQLQLGLRLALGASEVGHEHQPGAAFETVSEGRQGGADPAVVGHRAVRGLGDVEVHPDQQGLAFDVEVTNGAHGSLLGSW